MKTEYIINRLEQNAAILEALLKGVSKEEYLWKPMPGKWCMLEVVCHLCDEEREDFRARVKHILYTPGDEMKPIHPVEWVTERDYAGQDFDNKVREFLTERSSSITWLRTLADVPWDTTYHHPKLGAISAVMILANWLAHDYLHVRQITGLKYGYLSAMSGQDLLYAGSW